MTMTFALVGTGWRAEFFARIAALRPDEFRLTGAVTRTAARGSEVGARWAVPTWSSIDAMLGAGRPDVVVVATPWPVTPEVVAALVGAGLPVLAETPPAPDAAGLRALWARVGASGLVQVAEHSPVMPAHAARASLVASGAIGRATQVQISSTHGYHAMAVIRQMLGVAFDPVTVTARTFTAPLVDPVSRSGWTDDPTVQPASNTLALLDLGEERSALYDFSDNQWHNPLRVNRILVRGSHGEIRDDSVTRLVDGRTIVTSPLVRRQSGIEQDLDGFDLQHIAFEGRVLYRNPFEGLRLADDDLAVATLLRRTAAWVAGDGEPPYPLAEASQDHLLALAVEEAALSGTAVTTARETWAGGGRPA